MAVLAVEPLPAGARGGLGVEDQPVEIEEKRADGHRGDGIDSTMAGETRQAVFAQPEWLRLVPTDKRLPAGATVVHTGCGTSFHAAQTGGWAVQALEAVLDPPRADILVCVSHEGETASDDGGRAGIRRRRLARHRQRRTRRSPSSWTRSSSARR